MQFVEHFYYCALFSLAEARERNNILKLRGDLGAFGNPYRPILLLGVVMSWSGSMQEWLRLPGRIALLLGFGALSAAGAQADATGIDTANQPNGMPQHSAHAFGELRVWSDGARIYFAESGSEARELQSADTAEAQHLRQMLQRHGALSASAALPLAPTILAGGGGDGFHWTPARTKSTSAAPTAGPPATSFGPTKPVAPSRTAPPEDPGTSGMRATRTERKG